MAKNVIITKTARKKLVQARAGIISLPKIVGMAFGSGGVNSKGEVVPPTDNQTTLTAEMYRKKIDGYSVLSDTSMDDHLRELLKEYDIDPDDYEEEEENGKD